jgi:hypothetical protein
MAALSFWTNTTFFGAFGSYVPNTITEVLDGMTPAGIEL